MIQSGSTVYHRPTEETWTVLGVSDEGLRLCVGGWPSTVALAEDCDELPVPVRALTPEELAHRQRAFGRGWS